MNKLPSIFICFWVTAFSLGIIAGTTIVTNRSEYPKLIASLSEATITSDKLKFDFPYGLNDNFSTISTEQASLKNGSAVSLRVGAGAEAISMISGMYAASGWFIKIDPNSNPADTHTLLRIPIFFAFLGGFTGYIPGVWAELKLGLGLDKVDASKLNIYQAVRDRFYREWAYKISVYIDNHSKAISSRRGGISNYSKVNKPNDLQILRSFLNKEKYTSVEEKQIHSIIYRYCSNPTVLNVLESQDGELRTFSIFAALVGVIFFLICVCKWSYSRYHSRIKN